MLSRRYHHGDLRATLLASAEEMLREKGVAALSLRELARAAGVSHAAPSRHFKDKQALLDEMATEMYRRMVAGPAPGPDVPWDERLLLANRGLRDALLGYRDGAKVFSGSRFTGVEHAVQMEANLRCFVEAGFTPAQAVRANMTAYVYTIGFVTEEQGVEPLPGERREGYDVEERARRMADFPLSAAAGAEVFQDYDRQFEEGLKLVLAGIGATYGMTYGKSS